MQTRFVRAGWSSVALVMALASRSLAQSGHAPGVLDRLLYVRSLGTGRAFECSPDARWLFVAEAGSLAVIDAGSQSEYETPRSIVPLGRHGVLATDLLLDPDADDPYGDDAEDLLYVAAGRSGLWVANADTTPGLVSLDAARIDDASEESGLQDSRRWCSDLALVRMDTGETELWLAALFAAKDDTRVRLYAIERARGVHAAVDETGHEIAADVEISIGRHPLYPEHVPGAEDSRSFGYGMAVDHVGAEEASVYVALGEHGIARVRLTSSMLEDPPNVEWGPVFGAGSTYAAADPLYDDLRFVRSDTGALDAAKHPIFADVAVQRNDWGHFLYAAVDHLGWVRFDLDSTWSAQTAIEHHEGRVVTSSVGQRQTSLVEATDGETGHTFARRIMLLQRGNAVFLGVAASPSSIAIAPEYRTDGSVLNSNLDGINGIRPSASGPLAGERPYSIVYRFDEHSTLADHDVSAAHSLASRSGGDELLLLPEQASADPFRVELFAGHTSGALARPHAASQDPTTPAERWNCTSRSLVDLGAKSEVLRFHRSISDREGTRFHVIGAMRGVPEVILRGSNDCCTLDDGVYVICGDEIHAHYAPGWVGFNGPGDDDRGSFGVWFDPASHWRKRASNDWFVWGADDPAGPAQKTQPCVTRMGLARVVCGTGAIEVPEHQGRWFLEPSADRWGRMGRQYWMSGMRLAYDRTHEQSEIGWRLLFATRGGTPDGLVAVRRDLVERFVTDAAHPAGQYGFDLVEAILGENAFSAWWDTHPELQNVPSSEPGFLLRNGIDVQTFFPTLFRVPGPGASAPDTWVLGVPCGALALRPDLDDLQSHPEWKPPQTYLDHYDHLLVRFWEVDDPSTFLGASNGDEPRAPRAEILGPHERAFAVGLATVEWRERVLGFVTDHGGRILVYDLTRIVQPGGAPLLLHVWETPDCASDDLVNSIRSTVLDEVREGTGEPELHLYVGVQRVGIVVLAWNDAAQALDPVETIETPGDSGWIARRVDESGEVTLLVADGQGVRLYGRSE